MNQRPLRIEVARDPQLQEDRFLYALLFLAVISLPLAVRISGWVPDADRLLNITLWATFMAVIMARSNTSDLIAWPVGLILGLEYSLQFAGRLLPDMRVVLGDIGRLFGMIWQMLMQRALPTTYPFERSLDQVVERSAIMVENVNTWLTAVRAGAPTDDNTVLWFGVSLLIWVLTWNATYELIRRRRPFSAFLPLGTGLVANAAFTGHGIGYVRFFLAVMLLALVRANLARLQSFWSRLGMDFSTELSRDATIAGAGLSAVIIFVALLIPYVTYNDAIYFFWENVGYKLQEFYEELDRAFAGRNPVPTPVVRPGGLPGHAIRRSISSLGEDLVLIVRTSDPPPPPEEELARMGGVDPQQFVPKRYWRQRTYDVYTGHGWVSSEAESRDLIAEEPWSEIPYPHHLVTQTIRMMRPGTTFAYGVNTPVSVDRDARLLVREPEDLAAFNLTVEGDEPYTIVSAVPDVTAMDLRAAEEDYPDWVAERYLPLPDIPERIRQLADEIVTGAGATTRYDKARAIEAYIRGYDYDLNLEPPPLDTDVTDYFLFDVQRGYCDYSATAMAVMLRSIGVAARYASGYNMGHYDYARSAWVVAERNAHAWTEVYFPGYGWIEFEPTPTERLFFFTDIIESDPSLPVVVPVQPVEPEAEGIPLWIWGSLLGLVVLFVVLWPPRWFRHPEPEPRIAVQRTYHRLLSRARWLGIAPDGGQTPREYLHQLAEELDHRAGLNGHVKGDIYLIAGIYQRARYGDMPITTEERDRVEGAWRRLEGSLWRALFARASWRGAATRRA
ncbi:MAG: transglutaminase TgpA family protein [Anaerolineae bacterium]|jgi:hypothetical protein